MIRLFGRTDIGELGIREYFKSHRCNELCKVLELPKPSFQKNPDRFEEPNMSFKYKPTPVRSNFELNKDMEESTDESSEDELILKD
jgi:hypothetical protein